MIYCIGNNNYDVFFESGVLTGGSPGGSMLNVSVSLGRMNLPVAFLSRLGDDSLAGFIRSFLEENRVITGYLVVRKGKKTSLALAMLDEHKRPEYSFYGSAEPPVKFNNIGFKPGDILVLGSSYAIQDNTYDTVDELLAKATAASAISIYDPNIRKKCTSGFNNASARARRRIKQADLVKMSDEDMEAIGVSLDELAGEFPGKPFIVTKGSSDVVFRMGNKQQLVSVPPLNPVNTTGAGDAFNAGLVSEIFRNSANASSLHNLSDGFWRRAIEQGINTAAKVCQSKENFIPKPIE
ncbi:MAG TPA: PfkB family carbohydrate kinase [Bacteroidales bacterium]|nr:PfkB family carbohydrate kinase [Bacteroidales bacterium]